MKHISVYTREEILECLGAIGIGNETRDNTTEELRELLSELSADGDAPLLEEIEKD